MIRDGAVKRHVREDRATGESATEGSERALFEDLIARVRRSLSAREKELCDRAVLRAMHRIKHMNPPKARKTRRDTSI